MPVLKDHRGTVLYATLAYNLPDGTYDTVVAAVFNKEIGAVQADRFLMNDNTPAAFTDHYPQMIGATVVTVALSITYPDGTVAKIPEIPFGEIVLVGWSETQLLAVDPTPDPDWHQNRTYLRVQAT